MSSKLMTVNDLSDYLGISVSSIYRKRSIGEPLPPAIQIGKGSLRWRQADVDEWLDSRMEERNV